ncbi:MAG: hypothetical protein FWC92_06880 [Defluviitaleaceae bacterium]|nr:hypothetical protein [Defluviitaleaceae bacterium]
MKIICIVGVLLLATILVACGGRNAYCPEPTTHEIETIESKPTTHEMEVIEAKPICPIVVEEETETTSYIERGWLMPPYLVRLLPYRNSRYTDGMNIFTFTEDGGIYVQMHQDTEFALNIPRPPHQWEFDKETVNNLGLIVATNLDMSWRSIEYIDYPQHLVHIEGNTYFFHFTSPGGGSGEAFWSRDMTRFGSICADEHFTDLGVGAEHIVWHDGYFYFLDMVDAHVYWTPGVGTIGRMDMNGSNRTTIVESMTLGPFQIIEGRIFFSCLDSGLAYSVNLLGNDRRVISERIVPRYHRIWLEFYGSTIINRAWMSAGFGMGIIVAPSNSSNPAIMCAYGGCLVTFPNELRGHDPFEVVAYGYANHEFMVLRSNIDGSLWVYYRSCTHVAESLGAGVVFSFAREQLEILHGDD